MEGGRQQGQTIKLQAPFPLLSFRNKADTLTLLWTYSVSVKASLFPTLSGGGGLTPMAGVTRSEVAAPLVGLDLKTRTSPDQGPTSSDKGWPDL